MASMAPLDTLIHISPVNAAQYFMHRGNKKICKWQYVIYRITREGRTIMARISITTWKTTACYGVAISNKKPTVPRGGTIQHYC